MGVCQWRNKADTMDAASVVDSKFVEMYEIIYIFYFQ